MKVYLSGDLNSDWQDEVKKHFVNVTFFDPRDVKEKFSDPDVWTFEELDGIYDSDIIFAYLSKENPSGIGLALEIGYGKGYNKYVILVNEKRGKKWDMVETCADRVFDDLNDGIDYLERFIMLEQG